MMRRLILIAVTAGGLLALFSAIVPRVGKVEAASGGTLESPAGLCPLKHTSVSARVTGPLGRVTVAQEFENPFAETIEAVYTFPLPAGAAVDDMLMQVGDRTIKGVIKRREEARQIYNEARRQGKLASLLDQERPNIFTQAVANITPGAKVKITIAYVETMPYEGGWYEFRFPMVVAPRYMPGESTGRQGGGWADDTTQVPDASRISPNVTPKGTRAGHDISLALDLEAGFNVESLESKTHDVDVTRASASSAHVALRDQASIPNRDFVLRYKVAGPHVADSVLTHNGAQGGYFTLLLAPPSRVQPEEVTPKEIVFLLDTSGSMSGFPIEKAKQAMQLALDGLNPRDTFNLITFSGDTHILFRQPVPATPENLAEARTFLQSRYGSGGTEMMTAIRAALAPSDDSGHVRVVCFMTDGEVGNDFEIISEVQHHPNARIFAFGIGSSVNHFLLDNVARYGRGEVEYVGLKDDGEAAARRFHERVRSPLLTDISIDWGGLPVAEVLPQRIPDLFAARPLVISGRYTGAASGTIRLRGQIAGKPFTREIKVNFPARQPDNAVLATLWARRKVDDLMAGDFAGLQRGNVRTEVREQVTKLGLDYRLMTQFTSLVAVEEKVVNEGGTTRRVDVPVEMPEGMSREGVFGDTLSRSAGNFPASKGMLARHSVPFLGGPTAVAESAVPPVPLHPAPPPVEIVPSPSPAGSPVVSQMVEAVVRRVAAGGRPSVDEARFVFGGKARLRLRLSATTPEVMVALAKADFEITRHDREEVLGQIAVGKLPELLKVAGIVSVEPQ